ncbi:hypothetical protein EVAR_96458_1 [Eumeta japonica]|uniref:Uncharacterized protein n=1 Tax=Eumeta variegata TaxID=151549 RepID=A0A4C1VVZ8_EUMVA|nr:hypothetical protein EVAR_96458_1 [Eumeta japonica]
MKHRFRFKIKTGQVPVQLVLQRISCYKTTHHLEYCTYYALTDGLREGRPSTATTEDIISAMRLMIETGKRVAYQQIRTSLDIGMSQVYEILHEHLAVRKPCTR